MEIKIYNSLSNKLEVFKPLREKQLSMYVCGPTVYNHIHIGNARPVIFFDMIHRFFKYLGFNVTYITNFTDIDDKIIKKAKETKKDELTVAEEYIEAFCNVWRYLNCLPASGHPRVTQNIDEIIAFIGELKRKNYAYKVGDNVYFRVRQSDKYGILSNQNIEKLEAGSRVDSNPHKEDPCDFVLWKITNDDGLKWDSPFGRGRPGWHTECCVMIDKHFGGMIDIHGGGTDLKFPHHENELVQSYALHNHTIANFWVHNGRVDLNNEKMSKSLGNIVWVKDLQTTLPGSAIRLLLLNTNYRQLINYTEELVKQSLTEWNKIERTYISLIRYSELNETMQLPEVLPEMDNFILALSNDFSVPNALTSLQQVVKTANIALRNNQGDLINRALKTLKDMFYILGFVAHYEVLNEDDIKLVKAWQSARASKNFIEADMLKKQIDERDIKL